MKTGRNIFFSIFPIAAFILLFSNQAIATGEFTYTISNNVVTITGHTNPVGDLVIPETIEELPVTVIGDRAFSDCTRLTSITIPESVTSIGDGAFSGCSSLVSITVDEDNSSFTSLDGVLFTQDGKTILAYPAGKAETEYIIPDSVTSIGNRAFYRCYSLESIIIPDGVTSIGDGAFSGCSSLVSINIPDSVTSIGDWAFSVCSSLTSITIPDGVTRIGNFAFQDCSSLTSITIPDGVTSIGDWAFSDCTSLTSITIPESVTSIGDGAFTFIGYASLTSVKFKGNMPSHVGWGSFGVHPAIYRRREGAVNRPREGFRTSSSSTITRPREGVTSPTIYRRIDATGWSDTFAGRPVEIWTEAGHTYKFNEDDTISYTGNLNPQSEITIPSSIDGKAVVSISDNLFLNNTNITKVTFASSITNIGGNAFSGCSNLVSAVFHGNAPNAGSEVFSGAENLTIYYRHGTTGWDEAFPDINKEKLTEIIAPEIMSGE